MDKQKCAIAQQAEASPGTMMKVKSINVELSLLCQVTHFIRCLGTRPVSGQQMWLCATTSRSWSTICLSWAQARTSILSSSCLLTTRRICKRDATQWNSFTKAFMGTHLMEIIRVVQLSDFAEDGIRGEVRWLQQYDGRVLGGLWGSKMWRQCPGCLSNDHLKCGLHSWSKCRIWLAVWCHRDGLISVNLSKLHFMAAWPSSRSTLATTI